jgi:hypothetical protein
MTIISVLLPVMLTVPLSSNVERVLSCCAVWLTWSESRFTFDIFWYLYFQM